VQTSAHRATSAENSRNSLHKTELRTSGPLRTILCRRLHSVRCPPSAVDTILDIADTRSNKLLSVWQFVDFTMISGRVPVVHRTPFFRRLEFADTYHSSFNLQITAQN
jgi:hypothetical protein